MNLAFKVQIHDFIYPIFLSPFLFFGVFIQLNTYSKHAPVELTGDMMLLFAFLFILPVLFYRTFSQVFIAWFLSCLISSSLSYLFLHPATILIKDSYMFGVTLYTVGMSFATFLAHCILYGMKYFFKEKIHYNIIENNKRST